MILHLQRGVVAEMQNFKSFGTRTVHLERGVKQNRISNFLKIRIRDLLWFLTCSVLVVLLLSMRWNKHAKIVGEWNSAEVGNFKDSLEIMADGSFSKCEGGRVINKFTGHWKRLGSGLFEFRVTDVRSTDPIFKSTMDHEGLPSYRLRCAIDDSGFLLIRDTNYVGSRSKYGVEIEWSIYEQKGR